MLARDEAGDAGGSDRNAVLLGFDFYWNADDHMKKLREGSRRVNVC
jgi:hypothetical protein